MTVAKVKETQELVADLLTRTIWPNVGLPAASSFNVVPRDLKFIQVYAGYDYDGPESILVRHGGCRGVVTFEPDEQDPIMSSYSCQGHISDGYTYCDWTWKLADLLRMSQEDLRHHFYTELCEDTEDLRDWPVRLTWIEAGANRYTALRPCTREEVLTSRVKRLLEIREKTR
jgi:hypothetical protein